MRITDLEPGAVYVVAEAFRDDAGTLVQPGDRQTFERLAFGPDGRFHVVFREETLVVHEERQRDVAEHAGRFLRLAD